MFPFQQPNSSHIQDLGNLTPYDNNPTIQYNIIPADIDLNIKDHDFRGSGMDLIPTTSNNKRERIIQFGVQENHEERVKNDGVNNVRKYVHRAFEKQRRQEMANLCGSLRTLIPLQYVQGKRSVSDQLEGAVNYIKEMQNNIDQLKISRDKLKKLKSNSDMTSTSQILGDNCVSVNPSPNGVEILISTIFDDEKEEEFSLSRILRELLERGFNVVSCVSTKADQTSLCRIHLQASNSTMENLVGLQERLADLIN